MRCVRPLKCSYDKQGNITFNVKEAISGLVPFAIECRKCLPCLLNVAREKAVRCYHESKQYDDNMFLTLTYDPLHLTSNKLNYADFQAFMKRLRERIDRDYLGEKKICYMVTGEYGELNKRPHWHAIIFNYMPTDSRHRRTTDLGEKVFESELITSLWGKGLCEYGTVTMESAGYVARYGAKALIHRDQKDIYRPIHRTSCRRAIGRSWIEQNYRFTFENGFVHLPNGEQCKIPRYYTDWCKKHHPQLYEYYVTNVRPIIIEKAELQERKEELEYLSELIAWKGGARYPATRKDVKLTILKSKFKQLQERLKL